MSDESIVSIHVLNEPGKRDVLIALLRQDANTVIRTRITALIAAKDGASVVIDSTWDIPAAAETMRSDLRMKAYFPEISDLASMGRAIGSAMSNEIR
jgi:hypothetical protein